MESRISQQDIADIIPPPRFPDAGGDLFILRQKIYDFAEDLLSAYSDIIFNSTTASELILPLERIKDHYYFGVQIDYFRGGRIAARQRHCRDISTYRTRQEMARSLRNKETAGGTYLPKTMIAIAALEKKLGMKKGGLLRLWGAPSSRPLAANVFCPEYAKRKNKELRKKGGNRSVGIKFQNRRGPAESKAFITLMFGMAAVHDWLIGPQNWGWCGSEDFDARNDTKSRPTYSAFALRCIEFIKLIDPALAEHESLLPTPKMFRRSGELWRKKSENKSDPNKP